jgi:hypothetical protein
MRFRLHYNWYRLMGITGLCLLGYIVVIGIFGNTDISRFLPQETARSLAAHWPDMPFFKSQTRLIDDGKEEETFYRVPTRQLTQQEIAALKATGPEPKAKEVKASSSAQ